MPALLPPRENERLQALYDYQILDTAPEQEFDDLTRLATSICGTPIALISLVDANRQWFKSKVGVDAPETPRAIAFCAHAILGTDALTVHDATQDPRFADNPLVTGEFGLRAYAGVPLSNPEGQAIGTLCVIDTQPRTLNAAQLDALHTLGRQVMSQMELRRQARVLRDAQALVAKSEEQLSLAVAAGGVGFWDWDMAAGTVTMSRLHEELMGLPPTGLPRPVQDFFDRLHPDDAPRVGAEVNQAIATGTRYETEMRVVWPDGTVRWMLDTGTAQYTTDGQPYRMNGTMQDITERKRVEHDIAVQRERHELAVSAANTGVWDWEAGTGLSFLSKESRKILGYDQDELETSLPAWYALIHPDDIERVTASARIMTSNPHMDFWQVEHRSRHKDGHWRWILVQAHVQRDEQGQPTRMTGTHIDLTEQRAREAALAEAKVRADQANQAKSDFLANMSHEIRTPLTGIIGMGNLLAESPLAADQREFLDGIQTSADILLTLVNDVLDFSKVEAGKMTLDVVPFDLTRLLLDLEKPMALGAVRKGLEFRLELPTHEARWLEGDGGRLRQILTNLVGNAVKFTMRGSVTVELAIEETPGLPPLLRFYVRDTGIGMSEATMAQLFQPFAQGESARNRRFEGTGLGLSICKRLAELMNGTVTVRSVLGEGSEFCLQLRLPVATSRVAPRPPRRPTGDQPPEQRIGCVLVVEDNEINQKILLLRLKRLGLKAELARNGAEAVSAVQNARYDVVLMDCQMPEMDGYEATRRIRQLPAAVAQVPIVAMTANALSGERERCLASGMNDYLSKPIDEEDLVRKLDLWLDGVGLARR